MGSDVITFAENESFHAFMNCYLREIDAAEWSDISTWAVSGGPAFASNTHAVVSLALRSLDTTLAIGVVYESLVGKHHFSQIFMQRAGEPRWQPLAPMLALSLAVHDIYEVQLGLAASYADSSVLSKIKANQLQLNLRVCESVDAIAKNVAARLDDRTLNAPNFEASEQIGVLGHWFHPTPKSRQGMPFWSAAHYSPELKGRFQLHWFSVDLALIEQASSLKVSAADMLLDALGNSPTPVVAANHVLVPVHPLQAQNLLLKAAVQQLIAQGKAADLGKHGRYYSATSSVRTVFNSDADWMIKTSIPVKITNSLRCNKRQELEDGMVVGRYLHDSGFLAQNPDFALIDDPAFLTVKLPEAQGVESGFELVLRQNPFKGSAGEGICSVMALTQAPLAVNKSVTESSLLLELIQDLAKAEERSAEAVALDWFDRYFMVSIQQLIKLYDELGIALEAHQQNSLLDVSSGYPTRYFYRDNQGFYLSKHYRDTLADVEASLSTPSIMYEESSIVQGISYYLFANQLFAIIYRLGADGLADEQVLVSRTRDKLAQQQNQLNGAGKRFIEELLNSETLGYKTNLLARVHDVDELDVGMETSVYGTIPNPFIAKPSKNKPAAEVKHNAA